MRSFRGGPSFTPRPDLNQDERSDLELLCAAKAEGRPLDPRLFNVLAARGLVGLVDEMQREGLTAEAVLAREAERKADREQQAAAERARFEAELAGRLAAVTQDLAAEQAADGGPASVDVLSRRLRDAQRSYRRCWVGYGASVEASMRQEIARVVLEARIEQYRTLTDRLVRAFPFPLELQMAEYYGNLRETHADMDGRIHLVAAQPFHAGRYRREAGQTLEGKTWRDFHSLTPASADTIANTLVCTADLRVAEKIIRAAARRDKARP